MDKRSGVLLHITSLPSPFGVGDFGPGAYRFADFLSSSGQSFWQILPIGAINLAFDCSPYHSLSAFAGNVMLISPERLLEDGLLTDSDINEVPDLSSGDFNCQDVVSYKDILFNIAYERFKLKRDRSDFERFKSESAHWLDDYALFMALKARYGGGVWNEYPQALRDRDPGALSEALRTLSGAIEREKFLQYEFFRQWSALKSYCNERGIRIIGDVAIYMDVDSVDVWVNPGIFKLDESKKPRLVSGVPPDYFSSTGQLWGHPVYDWSAIKATGYRWWLDRIGHNLELFDLIRIDHFRGLVDYWEVPYGEKTAMNGRWAKAAADDFLEALHQRYPKLPIIAEDLGIITDEVRDVMRRFKLPGMKVLLFAFGEDNPRHPYLPQNFDLNSVVFTGTHDNNTVRGWFDDEASVDDKRRFFNYIKRTVPADEVSREFIMLAMNSPAKIAVVPMQDILGLGSGARMNLPGSRTGNWKWRLSPEQISLRAKELRDMTQWSGRARPA